MRILLRKEDFKYDFKLTNPICFSINSLFHCIEAVNEAKVLWKLTKSSKTITEIQCNEHCRKQSRDY